MVSPNTDEFLDLLASSQSRRLDDQRASFSNLPGLRLTQNNNKSVLGHLMTNDNKEPDEDFFDILVKCQVCVHICVSVWLRCCVELCQYYSSNLGRAHFVLGTHLLFRGPSDTIDPCDGFLLCIILGGEVR